MAESRWTNQIVLSPIALVRATARGNVTDT